MSVEEKRYAETLRRGKNIVSNELYEIETSDKNLEVVETSPGWAHSITNIGNEDIIVFLWANEIFDIDSPDTVGFKV